MYKYTCTYARKNVLIQFSWCTAFLLTRWKSSQQCSVCDKAQTFRITYSNLWRMSPGNYHACSICSFPQLVNGGLVQLKLTFQATANDFLSRETCHYFLTQQTGTTWENLFVEVASSSAIILATNHLVSFALVWSWFCSFPSREIAISIQIGIRACGISKKGGKKLCLNYWIFSRAIQFKFRSDLNIVGRYVSKL